MVCCYQEELWTITYQAPEKKRKAVGSIFYFTGVICKNGHIERRYANTGICYACKREQANRDYRSHTERVKECNHRTYVLYKDGKNRSKCAMGSGK